MFGVFFVIFWLVPPTFGTDKLLLTRQDKVVHQIFPDSDNQDDVTSDSTRIPVNLDFFGTKVCDIWVSANGLLTFDGKEPSYDAIPFPLASQHLITQAIAMYWTDLDFRTNETCIPKDAKITYRASNEPDDLKEMSELISKYQNRDYSADYLFVVNFENVYYWGEYSCPNGGFTFQAIIVTSENCCPYLILNYIGDQPPPPSDTDFVVVGYQASNDIFHNMEADKMWTNSNVGKAGLWMVAMGSEPNFISAECQDVYKKYEDYPTPVFQNGEPQELTYVYCTIGDNSERFYLMDDEDDYLMIPGRMANFSLCTDRVTFQLWQILTPNGQCDIDFGKCKHEEYLEMCYRQHADKLMGSEKFRVQPEHDEYDRRVLFQMNKCDLADGIYVSAGKLTIQGNPTMDFLEMTTLAEIFTQIECDLPVPSTTTEIPIDSGIQLNPVQSDDTMDCDTILSSYDNIITPKFKDESPQEMTEIYCSHGSSIDLRHKLYDKNTGKPIQTYGKKEKHLTCDGGRTITVWQMIRPDGDFDAYTSWAICQLNKWKLLCIEEFGPLAASAFERDEWAIQPYDPEYPQNTMVFQINKAPDEQDSLLSAGFQQSCCPYSGMPYQLFDIKVVTPIKDILVQVVCEIVETTTTTTEKTTTTTTTATINRDSGIVSALDKSLTCSEVFTYYNKAPKVIIQREKTNIYCTYSGSSEMFLLTDHHMDNQPVMASGEEKTYYFCNGERSINVWQITTPDGLCDENYKYAECKIAEWVSMCQHLFGDGTPRIWYVQPEDKNDTSRKNLFQMNDCKDRSQTLLSPGYLSQCCIYLGSEQKTIEINEITNLEKVLGQYDCFPDQQECTDYLQLFAEIPRPQGLHKTMVYCSYRGDWDYLRDENNTVVEAYGTQETKTLCNGEISFNQFVLKSPEGANDRGYSECMLMQWSLMCEVQMGQLTEGSTWSVQPMDLDEYEHWNPFVIDVVEPVLLSSGRISFHEFGLDPLEFSEQTTYAKISEILKMKGYCESNFKK